MHGYATVLALHLYTIYECTHSSVCDCARKLVSGLYTCRPIATEVLMFNHEQFTAATVIDKKNTVFNISVKFRRKNRIA